MLPIKKKNPTSNPAKIIQSATPQRTTELHKRRMNTERVEEVMCSRSLPEWENGPGVASAPFAGLLQPPVPFVPLVL